MILVLMLISIILTQCGTIVCDHISWVWNSVMIWSSSRHQLHIFVHL